MIPKTIHYCWFGGKSLSHEARRCIDSWRKFCPDYKIIRWDESNFDIAIHPFCKTAYDAKAWAFVSDYARLKIIYENGGIYLDTDVELLKSLDDLLGHECYMGVQQGGRLCNTGLGFGAIKSSLVVKEMASQYDGIHFSWDKAKDLACPTFNDRVARGLGYKGNGMGDAEFLDGLTVYPCRYFDPLAPGKSSKNLLSEETYSIHHYGNSWGTPSQKIRRSVINVIGPSRVAKIKEVLNGAKSNRS